MYRRFKRMSMRKRPAFLKRIRTQQRKRKLRGGRLPVAKRSRKSAVIRKTYFRPTGGVGSISSVLPTVRWVTHTFAQTYTVGHDAAMSHYMGLFEPAEGVYLKFRVNNPSDPCQQSGGVYDTPGSLWGYMSTYYSSYEVYNSKITIIFRQNDVNGNGTFVGLGIRLDDNATLSSATTNYESARQDPAYRCTVMQCEGGAAKRDVRVLRHSWSRKKLDILDRANNGGSVLAAPVYNEWFIPTHCTLYPAGGDAGPNWSITVRMSFFTRWSDRKDVIGNTDIIPDVVQP